MIHTSTGAGRTLNTYVELWLRRCVGVVPLEARIAPQVTISMARTAKCQHQQAPQMAFRPRASLQAKSRRGPSPYLKTVHSRCS